MAMMNMACRFACLMLTIGAVGVVGENPATIKTQSDGHELVMNVGGAQLLLRSNNNSGAVACNGPEVEIINGQCVARKDTLTKEFIKVYLDTLMEPVQSSIVTLKTGLTNVVEEIEDRVTNLESFSKGNASVIKVQLIPQIAKLTSDTATLNKTSQHIGDTTKKLNASIQTNGERIDWLNSYSQYKDETSFVVGGSSNVFYPVVFPLGLEPTSHSVEHKLVIYRHYAEKAPKKDSNWGNSNTHFGMQYTEIDALHRMWGGAPVVLQIKRNIYTFSKPFGGAELSQPDGRSLVVYLRGGGAVYHVWADMPVHSDNKAWCVPLMSTTKIYDNTDNQWDRSVSPRQMAPYRWCNPTGVAGGC